MPSSRVLIRLPNWVGDIMMSLPAIQAVRACFPDAFLVGMARPEHVELVRRISALDKIIPAQSRVGSGQYRAWWKVVRELRMENWQAAVLLAPSFEAAFTSWLAGVSVRVGHTTDHRAYLLTHPVSLRSNCHRSDGFLDVVAELGATPLPELVPLFLETSDHLSADRLFERAGFELNAKPIFVNPSSTKIPRAWSLDRFNSLIKQINKRYNGIEIFIYNYPPFNIRSEWLGHQSVKVIEGTSLVELAAVLARCSLYIGNDSGPLHIAASFGVPTIGIYGSSSPNQTSPRWVSKAMHLEASAYFSCSPCRERFFRDCPKPQTADGRPPCLDSVSVDMVIDQVDYFMGQRVIGT